MSSTPDLIEPVAEPAIAQRVWWPLKWLIDTTRHLVSYSSRRPLWMASMTVFVLAWTIELYIVQGTTLTYPNEPSERFAFWAPKIRLMLDLCFIGAITALLRRRWLCLAVAASFFIYLGLITYYDHFLRPLSLLTIESTWREATVVGGFAIDLVSKRVAAVLFVALAIKITALYVSRNSALPRDCAWLIGGTLIAMYAVLFAAANYYDPLHLIQSRRGVGRLGAIRGYLGPWFAEWYYLSNEDLLNSALERRSHAYDRLTPIEADIPIHKHLVILQAESFDTNILGYRANGVEVTPFLNRLREESMYFRVRSLHANGSADADFVTLSGVACSPQINTYSIPNYPYKDTTPQALARAGYETHAFHGNAGDFYNRRAVYEKMGFKALNFEEELAGRYNLQSASWGVSDREVLTLAAQQMRTADKPTCHFIITLTTHVPYTFLTNSEKEIFPHPRSTVENYINNMRYLDNSLRDYITALGRGTTVVIYSDHTTEEGDGSFEPDRSKDGGREFIPFFIYDTDQNLATLQKTRNQPIATDGTLNHVDLITYLRNQIARQNPTPPAGDQPVSSQSPEDARKAE